MSKSGPELVPISFRFEPVDRDIHGVDFTLAKMRVGVLVHEGKSAVAIYYYGRHHEAYIVGLQVRQGKRSQDEIIREIFPFQTYSYTDDRGLKFFSKMVMRKTWGPCFLVQSDCWINHLRKPRENDSSSPPPLIVGY
ncbi:MAG: hypothetical protein M1607_03065 [Patescibacteria group bacterium]|nr:hypothetical protein [Patescibacteria group bacterium]